MSEYSDVTHIECVQEHRDDGQHCTIQHQGGTSEESRVREVEVSGEVAEYVDYSIRSGDTYTKVSATPDPWNETDGSSKKMDCRREGVGLICDEIQW